jgi:hypothetical protein
MIIGKCCCFLSKFISFATIIIHCASSVSFDMPILHHTLRAESSALNSAGEIVQALKLFKIPLLAYESLPADIQGLVNEFARLDKELIKAYQLVSSYPDDPYYSDNLNIVYTEFYAVGKKLHLRLADDAGYSYRTSASGNTDDLERAKKNLDYLWVKSQKAYENASQTKRNLELWAKFYEADRKYWKAMDQFVVDCSDKFLFKPSSAGTQGNVPDLATVLKLLSISDRIEFMTGLEGLRSSSLQHRMRASETLPKIDTEISKLHVDELLPDYLKVIRNHMDKCLSLALQTHAGSKDWEMYYESQVNYYNAFAGAIDEIIAGSDSSFLSKTASAGVSVEVNRLFLNDIHMRETIDFLAGSQGLKSQEALQAVNAAKILCAFGAEFIEPYAEEIIGLLTGINGIKNTSPIKKIEAQEALIRLDKAVFSYYVADNQDFLSDLTGMDGLRNSTPLVRIYSARLLSRLDKDTLLPHIEGIMALLTGHNGLESENAFLKIDAAMALSEFEKSVVSSYADIGSIINFLTGVDGLKSNDPLTKIKAVIALKGFNRNIVLFYAEDILSALAGGRRVCLRSFGLFTEADIIDALNLFDEGTISAYIAKIIINLTSGEALKNNVDPWQKARLRAILYMLNKRYLPAFTILANYTGVKEPVAIFAKNTHELRDKINAGIFTGSDILCDINSSNIVEIYSKKSATRYIGSAESEPALKGVLENAIRYMLYSKRGKFSISLDFYDEAGNLKANAIKQAVDSLLSELKSRNMWSKVFAADALYKLDREIIKPILADYLPAQINELKAHTDEAYLESPLDNRYDFWEAYYIAQKEYYGEVVKIIDRLTAERNTILTDKTAAAGTLGSLVERMHRLTDEFENMEAGMAIPFKFGKFKADMYRLLSDFKESYGYNVLYDAAISGFAQLPKAVIWVLEKTESAARALENFNRVMPDEFKNINPSATIIINPNDMPCNQDIIVRFLSKSGPYREDIIKHVKANIVLAHEFNSAEDRAEHMIIISRSVLDIKGAEGARYLRLQAEMADDEGFAQIIPAIIFAKGLILFSMTKNPDIETELQAFYSGLACKNLPWNPKMLSDFSEPSGCFMLTVTVSEPVDTGYLNKLQRVSLQVFKAA